MQKNKVLFYSAVFIITFQTCSYSCDIPPEETAKLADEVAKVASEATKTALCESIDTISAVGACVGLVVNLYDIGKDVKSYLAPSKDEQARAQEVDKQLELIELRRNLRICLIENRASTEKGSLGIPSQCEQAAFLLGTMGAWNEVERMANIINKFNK